MLSIPSNLCWWRSDPLRWHFIIKFIYQLHMTVINFDTWINYTRVRVFSLAIFFSQKGHKEFSNYQNNLPVAISLFKQRTLRCNVPCVNEMKISTDKINVSKQMLSIFIIFYSMYKYTPENHYSVHFFYILK